MGFVIAGIGAILSIALAAWSRAVGRRRALAVVPVNRVNRAR